MKGLFIAIVVIILSITAYRSSSEIIRVRILDKEHVTIGGGKYLIHTRNEVFENTDSWLFLKFSSSDFQYNLKKGKSYAVKVVGWRIPFLSKHRNIVHYFKEMD